MTDGKTIKIKFSLHSGEAKIEAHGFKGDGCKNATKFLKEALGNCTDFQRKESWYEQNIGEAYVNTNLCG